MTRLARCPPLCHLLLEAHLTVFVCSLAVVVSLSRFHCWLSRCPCLLSLSFVAPSLSRLLNGVGVPLKTSLHKNHPLNLLMTPATRTSSQWATERLAYWEDGFLCFQSVTAYGTKHYMMRMKCDSALSPASSTKVITNYDWDNKCSIMTDCVATPKVASLTCPAKGTTPHQLSFGLVKFAVRYSKGKPGPLRKQV